MASCENLSLKYHHRTLLMVSMHPDKLIYYYAQSTQSLGSLAISRPAENVKTDSISSLILKWQ